MMFDGSNYVCLIAGRDCPSVPVLPQPYAEYCHMLDIYAADSGYRFHHVNGEIIVFKLIADGL